MLSCVSEVTGIINQPARQPQHHRSLKPDVAIQKPDVNEPCNQNRILGININEAITSRLRSAS